MKVAKNSNDLVIVMDKLLDTVRGIMVEGPVVNPWPSTLHKGLAQQNSVFAIGVVAQVVDRQEVRTDDFECLPRMRTSYGLESFRF